MRPSLWLTFACILALPDLYIWFVYLRKKKLWKNILFFLPLIFVIIVAVLRPFGIVSAVLTKILFCLLLLLSLPKIAFAIGSFISIIIGIWSKNGRRVGECISLGLAGVVFLLMLYACTFGRMRMVEKEQQLTFSELPDAFDGYRIVQISDLHVGSYRDNSHFVKDLVQKINALHPDVIVFTGDLVNMKADEVEPFSDILSQLHAKDGVYSVLGNHDYGTYAHYKDPAGSARETAQLIANEKSLGWQLLIDEHRFVHRDSDSIAIIGVGDIGKPPLPPRGNLKKAINGLDDNTFEVLLSHDPSHWRMEVLQKTGIELMLSGHTHAMQFKVGNFSPVKWMYDEWGGLYEENGQKLFVSLGLGGSMPFRLGATPEINVLILKKGK
ncbi:MAG: metallophosphoesterase [Bacteroidales bacterium]|nr:metallophosphoesterase [Bacteroidales bacterium]